MFDYDSKLDAVINALKTYNTTTASPDLSASMTSRIDSDNIFAYEPDNASLRGDRYPAIYASLVGADEEFIDIGETGSTRASKYKTVTFAVVGLYKKEGFASDYSALPPEIFNMARNIEAVFRKELTLSGTAMWCGVTKTDFTPAIGNGETWVKGVVIELEAKYLFK